MNSKHVVVVGAGPGGLTAAMILARRGVNVTVFEAQDEVGGRNAAIRMGPYTFDTGPTFLMLKSILDEMFVEAGTTTDALMDMRRLEPMYRLQFADRRIEPCANPEAMQAEIDRVFPGHAGCYERFMQREGARFRALYPCLQKPYHKLGSLLHPDLFKAIPHLALGKSLFGIMQRCFDDEQLALSFTFQAKYLGMSPWECPGLFSIIPYIEHAFGIYHPIGGLSRISDSMAEVAMSHGAEIRTGTPVSRVNVTNGAARGVELADGQRVTADDVVVNADFGHAMTHLFEPGVLRKYAPARLEKRRFSCSTFMLYLGVDRAVDLPHHTIFFADDYRANVEAIFKGRRTGSDISIYVRNATVTDPGLAPAGHAALYVLVPVANLRGEPDWETESGAFRDWVLEVLERRAGLADLRQHIVCERVVTPLDWRDAYHVYAGATFNLAHTLDQMIYLRPRNKFEEVDRCYLVGGGTHPGSGLPTIYESGRIAANLICEAYGIGFAPPAFVG